MDFHKKLIQEKYKKLMKIVFVVFVFVLICQIIAQVNAIETAKKITGEKHLILREETLTVSNSKFLLLNLSKLDLKNIPKGYKPLFALKYLDKVFVILSDKNYSNHLIMILSNGKYNISELRFRKVLEKSREGVKHVQEVKVKGEVKKMEGFSKCKIIEEDAKYGVLQVDRLYFDCYYTTRLGGYDMVTTHARGYIYYIPNDKVTSIVDMSYDKIHSPIVTKCWFKHSSTGTGTPTATIQAKGKYLICYVITSTQWTQRSQFVFDVYGLRDCDGSHTAWPAPGCKC
ncbi:MAG: hypothetical protein J7K23_02450 [Thermoproteales archaeon]|nr:hypothetical protein [Thermoproteales archaeon]